jgi:simple sugar transport system permease protein
MFLILKVYNLSAMHYLTLTLQRTGMLMIAMLAIVPTIYSGVGINFGITIGFISGLIGGIFGILTGLTGIALMIACIVFSIPFSVITGYGYGKLLNRVKGSETLISTYAGFAFVSVMSMLWIILNVNNEKLRFSNGNGIRISVNLEGLFKDVLTNWLSVSAGELKIPVGFLLICLAICFLFSIFMKTKIGITVKMCGYNPNYAKAKGINVDRYRTLTVIVSTMLAAVGICFYAQSFGYYQFYAVYMNLGFTCAAGILIGGATDKRVNIYNVIYGCAIYEAILTLSTPIANLLLPNGALPEIIRTLITNGVILYALVKGGKKNNE